VALASEEKWRSWPNCQDGTGPIGPHTTATAASNRRLPEGVPTMRTDSQRNYDEMSIARLTWVVLDRLVPLEDEAVARAALIARDPELHSLVGRGVLSEDQAIETLRLRQSRYGEYESAVGDRYVLWLQRLGTFFGGSFAAWLLVHLAR
jgi:hypothetical protein